MIIAFDLDDTLYDEIDFVYNGFNSVARYLEKKSNLKKKITLKFLKKNFLKNKNQKLFNLLSKNFDLKLSISQIKKLVNLYRYNSYSLKMKKERSLVLNKIFKQKKLYLVTDGNPKVQQLKIKKLKIKEYFKKIYYTFLFGGKAHKPSLKTFNYIIKREKIDYSKLIYIGDNPFKDFKNLNKKGAITIRFINGYYRNTLIKRKIAKYEINNFRDLIKILKNIEQKKLISKKIQNNLF